MGLKYCALLSEGTMLIHMSGLYKMLQTRAVSGCILLEGAYPNCRRQNSYFLS